MKLYELQQLQLNHIHERINPGDKVHTFETITKVVSGQTPEVLDIVADVYTKKSLPQVKPDSLSNTGTQSSSVAPGYTVDSYTI
jgi:UDP-N-acetyl-D-mannosaminuronate dehydrogenase